MGVFLGCAPRWALRLYSDEYGEPLFYIETARLVVALTIDDGPDPMTTPAILDVLARYRARGTFFLISGNIPGNEALVRCLLAEGHEIGNHMTRDEPSIDLPPDRFRTELTKAHQALSAYGPVRWFRPGGGRSTAAMRSAARQLGYRTALGEVYPFDPHIPSGSILPRWSGPAQLSCCMIVARGVSARPRLSVISCRRLLQGVTAS